MVDSLPLGFNEADMVDSSSKLIYLPTKQSIYAQKKGFMPGIIKSVD
jgi:hypothetical protein